MNQVNLFSEPAEDLTNPPIFRHTAKTPNKAVFSQAVSNSRAGLFRGHRQDNEVKELISKALPVSVKLGAALNTEDCFFDAVAQSLTSIGKGDYTAKSLREVCQQYVVNLDKKGKTAENWIYHYFLAGAKRLYPSDEDEAMLVAARDYQYYMANIQYTAAEIKAEHGLNCSVAICGEQDIDGRILSEQLGTKLHVIELLESKEGLIIGHQLASKSITEADVSYEAQDTTHIVVFKNHYVPILPATGANLTFADLDQQTVINESQTSIKNERIHEVKDKQTYEEATHKEKYTLLKVKKCQLQAIDQKLNQHIDDISNMIHNLNDMRDQYDSHIEKIKSLAQMIAKNQAQLRAQDKRIENSNNLLNLLRGIASYIDESVQAALNRHSNEQDEHKNAVKRLQADMAELCIQVKKAEQTIEQLIDFHTKGPSLQNLSAITNYNFIIQLDLSNFPAKPTILFDLLLKLAEQQTLRYLEFCNNRLAHVEPLLKALITLLNRNHSITYLDLSANDLTDQALIPLWSPLEKHLLTKLVLASNKLTYRSLKMLLALSQKNPNLNAINLEGNLLSLNEDDDLKEVEESLALPKSCKFFVRYNFFTSPQLKQHPMLSTSLDCNLGQQSVKALSSPIDPGWNISMEQWRIYLLLSAHINLYNHASILVEGLTTDYQACIYKAHIIHNRALNIYQVELKELNPLKITHLIQHTKHQAFIISANEAKQFINKIKQFTQIDRGAIHYDKLGYNCLSWAIEALESIGLQVNKRLFTDSLPLPCLMPGTATLTI